MDDVWCVHAFWAILENAHCWWAHADKTDFCSSLSLLWFIELLLLLKTVEPLLFVWLSNYRNLLYNFQYVKAMMINVRRRLNLLFHFKLANCVEMMSSGVRSVVVWHHFVDICQSTKLYAACISTILTMCQMQNWAIRHDDFTAARIHQISNAELRIAILNFIKFRWCLKAHRFHSVSNYVHTCVLIARIHLHRFGIYLRSARNR